MFVVCSHFVASFEKDTTKVTKKTERKLFGNVPWLTKNKNYLTIKMRKMWLSCELTEFGVNSCEKVSWPAGRGSPCCLAGKSKE
jgi:hypothetical protein